MILGGVAKWRERVLTKFFSQWERFTTTWSQDASSFVNYENIQKRDVEMSVN